MRTLQRVCPRTTADARHQTGDVRSSDHAPSVIRRIGNKAALKLLQSGAEASPSPPDVLLRYRDLLEFSGERGWHQTLPRSELKADSVEYVKDPHGGDPALGGTYPTHPGILPMDDPVDEAARTLLLEGIHQQLDRISIPTITGRLPVHKGGYAYTATSSEADAGVSREHDEFIRLASLEALGYDSPSQRHLLMWRQFRALADLEGDTAAINTWDSLILTVGAGFAQGGTFRQAGAVYNRMPQAFRQRLFEHGIRVNEDDSLTVLDLDRGVVEVGNNALRVLAASQRMLSLLIREAQSQTQMTADGRTMEERQWMLWAQFEEFMYENRHCPDEVLENWRARTLRFVFRMSAWQGFIAFRWSAMEPLGDNTESLATYFLRAVYEKHLELDPGEAGWTVAEVRERIRKIGHAAGVDVGALPYGPSAGGTTGETSGESRGE